MREYNRDYSYVPPKMYAFLVQLAGEYNLSMKEVVNTIIRKCIEREGFTCDHSRIEVAKSTGKPYCYNCWTRMRITKPGRFDYKGNMLIPPTYTALPTFMDEIEEKRTVTLERQRELYNENKDII